MGDARLAAFVARAARRQPDLRTFEPDVLEPPAVVAARVVNERLSVDLASRLTALARASAHDAPVVAALERLHADESSHVALATSMLERLGASPPTPASAQLRPVVANEPPALAFLREVLTGLVVCETVSAARFATV